MPRRSDRSVHGHVDVPSLRRAGPESGLPVLEPILGHEQHVSTLSTGEQRWTPLGRLDVSVFMETTPIRQFQFAHAAGDENAARFAFARNLDAAEKETAAE